MIYHTGRLMGPITRQTWSGLIDIIDDTEQVVRRLGLRPSGYAAAVKATLLLAAARAELAALYDMQTSPGFGLERMALELDEEVRKITKV
jgi:hypothetical protein